MVAKLEGSNFEYGSMYKSRKLAAQKGRNIMQPYVTSTRVTSKQESRSPNSPNLLETSDGGRTRAEPHHSGSRGRSHSRSGHRGASTENDYSQVNFSTSQQVPRELAQFFRYARKSALKEG